MVRLAFLLVCCFALAANAASLQDPTITTAYYTTNYVGGGTILTGINNNGIAVGAVDVFHAKNDPYSNSALVYDSSSRSSETLYGVPFPASPLDRYQGPTAINDNDIFVGYSYGTPGSSGISGFVGSYTAPNIVSPTVALNVPGATATYPLAINNQGTIVGGYVSSKDGLEHGFIYRADGSFQTLDNPAFRNTTLVGINNLGQIVGTGGINVNESPKGGFLYSADNSFLDLSYGQPVGINDLGAIAINMTAYSYQSQSYYPYQGGILYPDGTLAIVVASIQFSNDPYIPIVNAINNQGTLLFNSAYAFIATPVAAPVPEPSSIALLTMGALGLAGTCVWRRTLRASIQRN